MAQKFQYDESGTTFYYFLLSFLALVLVPCTYYLWPRKVKDDPEKKVKQCHCERCTVKNNLLGKQKPLKNAKQIIIKVSIICGWMLLFLIAYKVTQFDYEYANFDPYEILGVDLGASNADIKKAYKRKALVYHPDKETGDEKLFMKLTKAYDALTDETSKRNWELYGNPDGPSAISFGIALPSWIVEKENSIWVLFVYALVFMCILPVTVGIWWSRSIKYSGEKVLLDTSQMYYYFFHKTPNMVMKRIIMVLGASAEFHSKHNSEILERPSDNTEVPMLFKVLSQLNEKNKERPLCYSYSVKARALIHAHLSRLQLSRPLEGDRTAVIKKCPLLIQEMVVCISQLMMLAHAGRIARIPSLSTLEHAMKFCPMIVQALWDYKNPLLQLPHLEEDTLKHFNSRKIHVKTLEQLARLDEEDRRMCLRSLTEDQYKNVCRVLANMPLLDVQVKIEVVDDEQTTVFTAGAIVTVTVTLTRKPFGTLLNVGGESTINHELEGEQKEGEPEEKEEKEEEEKKKQPIWKPKTKPRKGGGGKKPAKKVSVQANSVKPVPETPVEEKKEESTPKTKRTPKKVVKKNDSESEEDAESSDESDSEGNSRSHSADEKSENKPPEDDDEEWDKFQNPINKRQKALEGKSRISHSVHCPYFPEDKQEYWWVYISDRKNLLMLTSAFYITNLEEKEDIQMRFTAPMKPGMYNFTLCVRSDSYLGFDQFKDIKMDVKEAAVQVTDHPQWDISSDEDDNKEASAAECEYATDDDDDVEEQEEED